MDDDEILGAENIRGAENVRGRENIKGRENITGAEDRMSEGKGDDNSEKLSQAASSMNVAAEELFKAAKLIESAGWAAALSKAKGHPIEFWAKDEGLQELAHKLKDIAAEMTPEPDIPKAK